MLSVSLPIELERMVGLTAPLGRPDLILDGQDAVVAYISDREQSAELRLVRVSPTGDLGEPHTVTGINSSRRSGMPRMVRHNDNIVIVWTDSDEATTVRAATVNISDI